MCTSLPVPTKMPAETFWTRYFFRVHQIDEDEARRKQVLEGQLTVHPYLNRSLTYPPSFSPGAWRENDEEFSWDMEDEDDGETPVHASGEGKGKSKTVGDISKSEEDDGIDDWGSSSPQSTSGAILPTDPAATATAAAKPSTAATSPRNSSEEGTASSFDVVSATSGEPLSENERAKVGGKSDTKRLSEQTTVGIGAAASKRTEDDDYSDWE
jgi:hypothetical protein